MIHFKGLDLFSQTLTVEERPDTEPTEPAAKGNTLIIPFKEIIETDYTVVRKFYYTGEKYYLVSNMVYCCKLEYEILKNPLEHKEVKRIIERQPYLKDRL